MRVKISAVAYLNAAPLVYGIQHSPISDSIDLSLDIPAIGAQKLLSGQADVALIPVAAIPHSSDFQIATDYCIGAVGTVATVAVFAHQPLETLHTIYLDAHSRSSVQLVQLLAREYWHLKPNFKPIENYGDVEQVKDGVGYLLIGDKTFGLHQKFSHVYDLAEAWIAHTGKPFVFAAWVAKKEVSASFTASLNSALSFGVQNINSVVGEMLPKYPGVNVAHYLTQNISYTLDEAKKQGMELFLQKIEHG